VYQRGTHAIILGERGVGKTSLANCLVEFIPNPHEDPSAEPLFMTPRVNCTGASTYDSVWREIFTRITFIKRMQQARFSGKPEEEIKNFAQLLPEKITPSEVQQFLDIAARQKNLIIVIDEFDKLRDRETKNLMAHTVKALSDHSVDATLLLVGVGDNIDELIAEHQSITRCLGQIVMARMSPDDVRELVRKGIDRFNAQCTDYKLEATDEALGIVAVLSKGMPHYAHLLSQQMCCEALKRRNTKLRRRTCLQAWGKHSSALNNP
jgi:Cdc6-like AAA superfamily ATPase